MFFFFFIVSSALTEEGHLSNFETQESGHPRVETELERHMMNE